jgi:hypothetical protein
LRSRGLIAVLLAGCAANAPGVDVDTSGESSSSSSSSSGTTSEPVTTGAPLTCEAESDALYSQRIAPLLATDRPKTCNTCHLSGIDLDMFVQDSACQTMACLDAKGLVDLERPAESVVLQWISRADPASPLIDQGVIDEEYAAFLAWIEASASCGLCYTGDAPCGAQTQEPCAADDPASEDYVDPGGCEPVVREALFRHRVYAWRQRCAPCHFDDTTVEAPKWIATGGCELGSLETMRNVFERDLIDHDDPAASLLLLKPLAESAGGVVHGGHDKFASVEDPAYVDFLSWLEREAACTP